MDADMWLALPCDLLVDIFRRIKTSAVIRCAGACRQWRRTIIGNARCLRPRPDRFLPDLLLGFWDLYWRLEPHRHRGLQYVPACNTAVPLFTPATNGVSVDGMLYNYLLASRDGFLLLGLGEDKGRENLCLWSATTGICRVLPAAKFRHDRNLYVLATGYDVNDYTTSDDGDDMAVWILAVEWQQDAKDGTTYQIFSSRTTAWGPVKRSAKFPGEQEHVYNDPRGAMVCRGAVSWFVLLVPGRHVLDRRPRMCMFSMDLRTERTWTTELPDLGTVGNSFLLAVSEDGRLSLVKMLPSSHQMEVWVLVGDGSQWTLRRTIDDVQKLLPDFPSIGRMRLSSFCPRSGYLFGTGMDEQGLEHLFLIGVNGSSPRLIGRVESGSSVLRFPYEMDWSAYISSYISKMKYF